MATQQAAPVAIRPVWNTLQLLKGSLYAIWFLDVILLLVALGGIRAHRTGLKAIGKDTAPSIIAAQHIKSALADMDAKAANELLSKPGQSPEVAKSYETRRQEAAQSLIAAAENITFDEAERVPILNLQLGMGAYEGLIQRARDLHERGDARAVDAYRKASALLDEKLLPAADALDQANRDGLDRGYKSARIGSMVSRSLLFLAGGALLGGLLVVQIFLSHRTRRTFNVPLVVATLGAVWLLVSLLLSMTSVANQLRIAKEDAFTSIHALWRARAVAYWASADESRYLLDAVNSAALDQTFQSKIDLLAKSDGSGYLGDAVKNVKFPGEREAASDMLASFREYLKVDATVRQLKKKGDRDGAVTLSTGSKTGQSKQDFEVFDQALGTTLDINQKAFDSAVNRGVMDLANFEVITSVSAAAIALLAFLGLMRRIREYL